MRDVARPEPQPAAVRLARRLRDLRERAFTKLTQEELGRALGGGGNGDDRVSTTTISMWENPTSGRIPPAHRLEAYALLFCTARSFEGGAARLIMRDQLTPEERREQDELRAELLGLRGLIERPSAEPRWADPATYDPGAHDPGIPAEPTAPRGRGAAVESPVSGGSGTGGPSAGWGGTGGRDGEPWGPGTVDAARPGAFGRTAATPDAEGILGRGPEAGQDGDREAEHRLGHVPSPGRGESPGRREGLGLGGSRPPNVWRFAARDQVTIVCGRLPGDHQPPQADPGDLNYVRMARFADLDTLVDVYGAVKANNPDSVVILTTAKEMTRVDALNHLVLIGNTELNLAGRWFARHLELPLRVDETGVHTGDRSFAYLLDDTDGELIEDVGVFVRGPHPSAPHRTLTMCNGITTRGVRGAAQCFLNPTVRERNARWAAARFPADSTYCVVMRVPVLNGEPLPQVLEDPANRLFEWPTPSTP